MREIYPWQAAALECGLDGSNFVYCAPTSGGKSLVAEVLMLRKLLATRKPGARFKHKGQVSIIPRMLQASLSNCSSDFESLAEAVVQG